ncbi:hypothetical protein BDE02_01G113900 [Populus trichocarpa]|nr:hypothetical protein BDE02_01G113900 [Populus trichocarpa]
MHQSVPSGYSKASSVTVANIESETILGCCYGALESVYCCTHASSECTPDHCRRSISRNPACGYLGGGSRKHLNNLVFFVLSPALVGSNLAKYITLRSLPELWLDDILPMPMRLSTSLACHPSMQTSKFLHILPTLFCPALLFSPSKTCRPSHRREEADILFPGNLDKMLLVIVLAVCKEKGSPFGVSDVCTGNGMAYVSLSMAIGSLYIWSYVYNIVRIYSSKDSDEAKPDVLPEGTESAGEKNESAKLSEEKAKVPFPENIKRSFLEFTIAMKEKFLEIVCTGNYWSGMLTIVGLMIGIIPPFRKVLIGDRAPLHAVEDSADMVGKAAIPIITLILGANLLKGLKGSKVPLLVIIGIVAIRYIILPILGVVIIKYAIHFRLVRSDPLYQFVLLLQFALPPANSVATMSQLFGVGQTECSVIMLWTNALATVSLTVWSTFFIWFVR